MAVNKSKVDYDNDGIAGTAHDLQLAEQDIDSSGDITPREAAAAKKKAAAPQVTTSTTKYDSQGKPVSTVSTTPNAQPKEEFKTAQDFGISKEALAAYGSAEKGGLEQLIRDAIAGHWDENKFNSELDKSAYGQARTSAQEAFDVAILGPKKDDWLKQIADKKIEIQNLYTQYGVKIDPAKLDQQAKEAVRSKLTTNDIMGFIASAFTLPAGGGTTPETRVTGEASQIYDTLKSMARSYGVTLSETDLQDKMKTALGQGAGWQSWVEGQRNVFRQQAKNLYPKIAQQLDTSTVTEIMDPYLNDAAELLGINKANMDPMDPTWTGALNGPNGPLSRDEWMRVLKTDPKFGWDRTTKARQEYSGLADQLTAAFGRA